MSFDLSQIVDVTSAEVALVHPLNKTPLGATITVAGPEHPQRRQFALEQKRRLRAKIQKAGRLVLEDPEHDAEETVNWLVACTLGWKGLRRDGLDIPFTPAEARALYEDERLAWLREQVLAALEERELFISASSSG